MSEEMEGAVIDVLREHGDGAVDVGALRVGSLARARTIRRRRIGLAGAGVAALLVGVAAIAPHAGSGGDMMIGAPPSSAPPPRTGGVALSLPPSNEPGAADRPESVAKDPGTLHFDVDTAALGGTGIWYNVEGGVESADVWNGAAGHLTTWFRLAQRREDIDHAFGTGLEAMPHDPAVNTEVFGRPATMVRYPGAIDAKVPLYRISWQPTDGLWAGVDVLANDADSALKATLALKLNRSQRCAVPFRIAELPAGYTWAGCSVSLGPSKPWETSGVTLVDSKGNRFGVNIGNYSTDQPFAANTTVGGRPAQWLERSQQPTGGGVSSTAENLFVPIQDWVNLSVSGYGDKATLTEAEAKHLAELVDVGTNFTDPASWPAPPVG